MVYCEKCARILDEDVQFCPVCKEEDADWGNRVTTSNEKVEEIIPNHSHLFGKDVYEKLSEINTRIEENIQENNTRYIEPVEEYKPGALLYILMVFMSLFLGCLAIILGVVFVTGRNKNYHTLGVVTIIACVISAVLWILPFMLLLSNITI